jgi:HEAT repeat protein
MGIDEAFAYLRSIDTELGVVAFGLMHDPDPSAISDLVEHLMETVANDRIASTERATDTYLVSDLLLKSRDSRCLAALQGAVKAAGNSHRRSRFLLRLFYTLEHYPCVSEERVVLEEQWAPLLIEYALRDENDEVRDAAASFLHALDRDPAGFRRLPKQAHDAFLQALGDPSPVIRARALEAMRFPALHEHLDIVWKLLDEDDSAMVFSALFHLRLCGKDSLFFRAVLKVLRRYAHKETALHWRAGEILAGLRIDHAGPRSRLRSIALLMSGAERDSYKPGSAEGLALYSVLTLGRMRIDWIAPFLARVLCEEGWDRTRCAALDALIDLLGDDAQSFVLQALSDRSSRIRDHATWICWNGTFGRDFPARSGPLLLRLIGDESQETSRNAVWALKKFGFISDDWHPFHGPPTYLGPAAESAATAR